MSQAPAQENLPVEALVSRVVDEFMARLDRGEQPDVEEYARLHPPIATFIRQVLPALQAMRTPASAPPDDPSSPPAHLPGYLGDYRIVREVGRGGMGVVYEAVQTSLARRVALKVLPFAAALDANQLQRFRNEAQAAAHLHHQNIVPVHAVGCERGVHYYAMQFIDGMTLAALIRELRQLAGLEAADGAGAAGEASAPAGERVSGRRVPPRRSTDDPHPTDPYTASPPAPGPPADETTPQPAAALATERSTKGPAFFRSAARLGVQAAEALEHAHQQGVVHRDVKPANLLVDGRGNLWITDFGLARCQSSAGLTLSGDLVGTLRYMSPEQALGQRVLVDHRTDIYSLGVTLYELLTLEPALTGRDRQEVLRQIASDEPRPPRRLNPAIPWELETILLKAIAKSPAERYATAQELADDLGRFLADKPIQARRVSWTGCARRWCRRNAALAMTIGMALAALLAATVVFSLIFAVNEAHNAASVREANQNLKKQTDLAKHRFREARRESALFSLAEGLRQLDKKEHGPGMLWLGRSLDHASQAQAADLEDSVRLLLTVWYGQLRTLDVILPHPGTVQAVAFSPDGKTVLTGSGGGEGKGEARLWDAVTGRPLGQPLWHQGPVLTVAFSPDGKTVLTGSDDKTTRLWEVATGKQIGQPLQHQEQVNAVALSPDGKTVLTGSGHSNGGGKAQRWVAATGQPLGPPLVDRPVLTVAFSPDGKTIVTGSRDKTARLWEAARCTPLGPPLRHQGPVLAVAFSPDGKTIVTGSRDKTARLWEAARCTPLGPPLRHQNEVLAVAFSPDGKTLLTGSGRGEARLWEVATGKPLQQLPPQGEVRAMAFSPDTQTLLTGGAHSGEDNEEKGRARLWHVRAQKRTSVVLQHGSWVEAVAFSPDGKSLLTGSRDNTARLWEAATGKLLHTLPHEMRSVKKPAGSFGGVEAVAFSPDGKSLLTGSRDNTARLWKAATGKLLHTLPHQGEVHTVAFSPDGKIVLTSSDHNTARLWEVATGEPLGPPLKHPVVMAVAFSPDGKVLLTGSSEKGAQLWEVATGQPLGPPLEHEGVYAVAFSPDGKTVLTGGGRVAKGDARLWEAATGNLLHSLPHQGVVLAVAFSPDGKTVLTGSDDKTARLWRVATGQPLGQPLPHGKRVNAVAFSPDGRIVVTGSGDWEVGQGGARLWVAATGRPLGPPLKHDREVGAVAFSPDGKTVVTAGQDQTARLWEVPLPVAGDVKRVLLWTQVITGMELDDGGGVRPLDADTWQQRRQRLEELGGPPIVRRLDADTWQQGPRPLEEPDGPKP